MIKLYPFSLSAGLRMDAVMGDTQAAWLQRDEIKLETPVATVMRQRPLPMRLCATSRTPDLVNARSYELRCIQFLKEFPCDVNVSTEEGWIEMMIHWRQLGSCLFAPSGLKQ